MNSMQGNGQPATFGASNGAAGAEPVKDITTAQFMSEVVEASRERPVLVDFWAPWCGPCRQLAPALEKVVGETRGKVKLVKMNIDKHPEIAGRMGVQSIPAVVAFVDGQPRDAFMGAIPEGEIRKFLDKLGVGKDEGEAIAEALQEAQRLAAEGAVAEAANLYSMILQSDPANVAALAGMGMLYLSTGDAARAQAMLDAIPEKQRTEPAAASLKAAIDLESQMQGLAPADELLRRIEADPKDHQARFDLALRHNAAGRREEAADCLLEIVRRDRKWKDDGARGQLLQFFDAWGPTDPATLSARRRLSSILFS
jgi:putative thioredoxin